MELGLSVADLDHLDFGMVVDMLTEKGNDDVDWPVIATQDDFNKF